MKEYVLKDQKKMRRGITTGSCAAAAARADTGARIQGRKLEVRRLNADFEDKR